MRTFRARLAFWIAASTLLVLIGLGTVVYLQVKATLQEGQDEALLEITRTEITSNLKATIDTPDDATVDESILAWESDSGKVLLERGPVSLRSLQRIVERPEFQSLQLRGKDYRALFYPYKQGRKHYIALCVFPSAQLNNAMGKVLIRLSIVGLIGAGMICVVAWYLAVRLTAPLKAIALRTASLQTAHLKERLPCYSDDAELVAVTEGLNSLLTRLEAAFVAQGRFVADAAHELRSPLANIRTTAEVALRRKNPATNERALEITVSETDRLTRLTESLLTLSLADAGTLVQERALVDLSVVAREAVEAIRARAEAASVQLSLKVEPLVVLGDALRLRQVFDNLLDNALRYSPGGHVEIAVREQENGAMASVRDEGPGILESDLPLIFERLWRADMARARATGGFGLGLSIARAIVQAHGGTIQVENLSPKGAVFSFRLPIFLG